MGVYEIKDGDGVNISAKNTKLRTNILKLKNSKKAKKKYWQFIPTKNNKFYLKNIYFNSYLFHDLENNKTYLSKKNKSEWDIKDGFIKKYNKYLSNNLELNNKPFKWDINEIPYINYIVYVELALILISLLLVMAIMIYKKTLNLTLLLIMYIIITILLIVVIGLKN